MITVYTDGSSLGNPGPWWRAALIIQWNKHSRLQGGEPHTTNNKMELTAVLELLHSLYKDYTWNPFHSIETGLGLFDVSTRLDGQVSEIIRVYTDSEYVRKGVLHYLPVRQRNGRKTTQKKPVQHTAIRQQIALLLPCFTQLSRERVAGHSGHRENDAVDKRARAQALHHAAKKL